jgi:hypothetical protein
MNTKRVHERLNQVLVSWEKVRPSKSFAGMTLEQFREAVRPAVENKERGEMLRRELNAVRALQLESDKQLLALIQRVVSGVKADDDEGPDGELYDAMGYVRSSERSTADPQVGPTEPKRHSRFPHAGSICVSHPGRTSESQASVSLFFENREAGPESCR